MAAEIFPAESGALQFFDFFESISPTDTLENEAGGTRFLKGFCRLLVSSIAIPIFATIGALYNFVMVICKLPFIFSSKDKLQIWTHHLAFMTIDALAVIKSTIGFLALCYCVFPKETIQAKNYFKSLVKSNFNQPLRA